MNEYRHCWLLAAQTAWLVGILQTAGRNTLASTDIADCRDSAQYRWPQRYLGKCRYCSLIEETLCLIADCWDIAISEDIAVCRKKTSLVYSKLPHTCWLVLEMFMEKNKHIQKTYQPTGNKSDLHQILYTLGLRSYRAAFELWHPFSPNIPSQSCCHCEETVRSKVTSQFWTKDTICLKCQADQNCSLQHKYAW